MLKTRNVIGFLFLTRVWVAVFALFMALSFAFPISSRAGKSEGVNGLRFKVEDQGGDGTNFGGEPDVLAAQGPSLGDGSKSTLGISAVATVPVLADRFILVFLLEKFVFAMQWQR